MDHNGFYGAVQVSNGVVCPMGIALSGPPRPVQAAHVTLCGERTASGCFPDTQVNIIS